MPVKRYNILFLTKWYPNKFDIQLGVFVRKHAKAVVEYCNCSLLYVFADDSQSEKYKVLKSEEHGFYEVVVSYKKSSSFFKLITNSFRYFKANSIGYRVVKKQMPVIDLVQVNVLTRPALLAIFLNIFKNIPYIVVEHWTGYSSGKYQEQGNIKKEITKYIIKKSKAVVVVSEALKNKMLNLKLKNSYAIIPNVIENISINNQLNNEVVKILTVADLYDSHKNISGIIKLVAKLSTNNEYKFQWHIIGGGPDEKMLKELSNELDLTNKKIFFHGRQTNEYVYEQYKSSNFVVINSRLETFSVVAAEALVNGKPIVTTICGGPEEFVTAKQGILIEKNNAEQLESAVIEMINSYEKYDPQALNEYAMDLFSYKKVGEKFNNLYTTILN